MKSSKQLFALGSALLLGLAGVVHADTTTSEAQLRTELAEMKARVNQLEGKQSESWLNQRRAEEVKALVKEVLADADTRASLLDSGATAGHNGKNFFLASEDGNFLLKISGLVQVRYVANVRNNAQSGIENTESEEVADEASEGYIAGANTGLNGDDSSQGFELRRTEIAFSGHIGTPKFLYSVGLQADRYDETIYLEHAKVGYTIADGVTLWGGEDKEAFLREEMIGSGYQLAAERSMINSLFTAGRVQGIWVNWDINDMVHLSVGYNDGAGSGESANNARLLAKTATMAEVDEEDFSVPAIHKGWEANITDYCFTSRIDVKLMGDWAQWNDFSSWSGSDTSLFIGAATRYEIGSTGNTLINSTNFKNFAWTVDSSFKMAGFSVYSAIVGSHLEQDDSEGGDNGTGGAGSLSDSGDNLDSYGVVAQVSYMVIPDKLEPFVRYELTELDDPSLTSDDQLNILTFGANYYFKKHDAKFTLDVMWAMDPIAAGYAPAANLLSGQQIDLGSSGFQSDGVDDSNNGEDDQFVIRAQFQLLF